MAMFGLNGKVLRRVWRNFDFRYFNFTMLLFSIILFSLLLVGCTSSSSTRLNIYLISLAYQSFKSSNSSSQVNPGISQEFDSMVKNASLEVRTGYFSLCVKYLGGGWECDNEVANLAKRLQPTEDPLNLIWQSARFKDSIVFYGLIIAATALVLVAVGILMTFPNWYEEINEKGSENEVKAFPNTSLLDLVITLSIPASVLALLSMLWQHVASVAMLATAQNMAYGTVTGKIGTTGLILGWFAVAMIVVGTTGLVVMKIAIKQLDELTDE